MTSFDQGKKLVIVKTLKQLFEWPLKDAKEFLDQNKTLIKGQVEKEEAQKLKELLAGVGCVVELK